jgi:hypothetical protein
MLQEIHAGPMAHRSSRSSSPSGRAHAAAKISKIVRSALRPIAKIFDAIAEQRDRQAKEIIARYGHDRWSDSIEREIGDAALGKRTRL